MTYSDRYLAMMGLGPPQIPHWEHWYCQSAEAYLTGLDYFEHPRQCRLKMSELHPELALPIPDLRQAWEAWHTWYDQVRPHSSLGEVPPASRYTPSRRPAPRELRKLLQIETTRLVRRDAATSLQSRRLAVPPELMGKHVWVGRLGDTITVEHAGHAVATYTHEVFTFGVTDLFSLGGYGTPGDSRVQLLPPPLQLPCCYSLLVHFLLFPATR